MRSLVRSLLASLLFAAAISGGANAQLHLGAIRDSRNLPPGPVQMENMLCQPEYRKPDPLDFLIPQIGGISVFNIRHIIHEAGTLPPGPGEPDTEHSFRSWFIFDVKVGNTLYPNLMSGEVVPRVRVRFLDEIEDTQWFETEMLQMNLTGGTLPPGFIIREDPDMPSLGVTTIREVPGGLFRIDSFFDIFVELSIDGGNSWIDAQNGPGRVVLHDNYVPEPGSLTLLGAGLTAGCLLLRRRRTR